MGNKPPANNTSASTKTKGGALAQLEEACKQTAASPRALWIRGTHFQGHPPRSIYVISSDPHIVLKVVKYAVQAVDGGISKVEIKEPLTKKFAQFKVALHGAETEKAFGGDWPPMFIDYMTDNHAYRFVSSSNSGSGASGRELYFVPTTNNAAPNRNQMAVQSADQKEPEEEAQTHQ